MGIQVTELTNGKACHEKEFIDFEFAGRHISEFGMVAVADGGRHSFDAAPTFEDETSTVNGVDGQYFWGTHFRSKRMTFSLATDGMTEAQVNDFKHHFQPGKYGKFIEDKLACRYNYARVSQITTFNMVPFRIQKTIKDTIIYINEYKGDCRITFEFDEPYFKATRKYIDDDKNEEQLRAMYINGIPLLSSMDRNLQCLIGDEEYYLQNRKSEALSSLETNKLCLFYNPSTAKTKTKIELSFTPKFSSTSFPVFFYNIYDDINASVKQPYNRIKITNSLPITTDFDKLTDSQFPYEFRYTSPNVIYSINKAISMAYKFANSDNSVLNDFEEQLRLEITNPKVMGWAASILRIIASKEGIYYTKANGNFNNTNTCLVDCSYIGMNESKNLTWAQYFNVFMLYMLAHHKIKQGSQIAQEEQKKCYHIDNADVEWDFDSYTIIFDGEKNEARMNYTYNQIIDLIEEISVTEESCGDMILSEYLNLDGGDILTEDGSISSCHRIKFIQGARTIIDSLASVKLIYTPTYY